VVVALVVVALVVAALVVDDKNNIYRGFEGITYGFRQFKGSR
jgi:hypothetical protein